MIPVLHCILDAGGKEFLISIVLVLSRQHSSPSLSFVFLHAVMTWNETIMTLKTTTTIVHRLRYICNGSSFQGHVLWRFQLLTRVILKDTIQKVHVLVL